MTWGEMKKLAGDTPDDAHVTAHFDKFFEDAEVDGYICDYFEIGNAIAETEFDGKVGVVPCLTLIIGQVVK